MPSTARLFAVLTCLALGVLAFGPKSILSDGINRRDNLRNLIDRGTLATKKFSHVGPVFSAPLLLLDRTLGTNEMALVQYNWLLFAGGVAALAALLPPAVRWRFAALLVFGSMFPANTLNYFGEMFTTMAVAVGFTLLVVRRTAWGWLPVVLGVVNAPASAVGLALAVGVSCWHERRLRALLILPLAAGGILLENWLSRGSPLATGYEEDFGAATVLPYSGWPGFSYPLAFGLLSLLFSFGKGLVFFTPGLFVPPLPMTDDRVRRLLHIWIAFTLGLLLVYARWWAWYGGLVWGPRMMLFASLPASLILARLSAEPAGFGKNLLTLAALLLSCWVGVSGFAFSAMNVEPFVGANYQTEFSLWYVPECSVLWLPFVIPIRVHPAGYAFLALGAIACGYLCGPTLAVALRQGRELIREAIRNRPTFRI